MELGLKTVGPVHVMMDRLLLNMAIYYEEIGDYYKAYELFYRWYEAVNDIYGPQHPKSARPVNTLREPMYRRIALEKGNAVPELYTAGQEQEEENTNNSNSAVDSNLSDSITAGNHDNTADSNIPAGNDGDNSLVAVNEEEAVDAESIAQDIVENLASLAVTESEPNEEQAELT